VYEQELGKHQGKGLSVFLKKKSAKNHKKWPKTDPSFVTNSGSKTKRMQGFWPMKPSKTQSQNPQNRS
jgi:hypothetical protein